MIRDAGGKTTIKCDEDTDFLSFDMDPTAAKASKLLRDYHYNVKVAPVLRLVGFIILTLFVFLHNQWIQNKDFLELVPSYF